MNMDVRVTIDLTVAAEERHFLQMHRAAGQLTDRPTSVHVSQPPDDARRITAAFTVTKARQGDVVDRIGKEFWKWIEDYRDSSIGFPQPPRKPKPSRVPKEPGDTK